MNGPERAPIDAILFDLGGVLMAFDGLRRLARLTGEAADESLRRRWVDFPWVRAFECGGCTAEDFAEAVVREWGLDVSRAEFLADFSAWPTGPFPGSLELVQRLHGSVRMGCLSNTNPVHWQRHLDRWGVVRYFDWTFASHELGMMKPDPAVYDQVIRTIGTSPDRLLFLDDSDANVLAAQRAGMRAERARGLQEVLKVLRRSLPAGSAAGRALRSVDPGPTDVSG